MKKNEEERKKKSNHWAKSGRSKVMTLEKRRIVKADGRYLIFYSFGPGSPPDAAGPAPGETAGAREPHLEAPMHTGASAAPTGGGTAAATERQPRAKES